MKIVDLEGEKYYKIENHDKNKFELFAPKK